jgi:hypothetical protein
MKTLTIRLATDHVNMDREIISEHKDDFEVLHYLIGFVNTNAAFGELKIQSVEVK